jgi:DNA excision repair protein ERCC-5
VPYLEAPFEAESQCAHLEMEGIVDGVVTEDSDVFLFGARHVYKDIFDQNQFVEEYTMKTIYDDTGLQREDLILLALMLGSDYTIGVWGIGPVNGMETVQAFHDFEGIQRFKEWADKGTFQEEDEFIAKTKEYHKFKRNDTASKDQISRDIEREIEYKKSHKSKLQHWEFPSGFPDKDIFDAYSNPNIRKEKRENFSWGQPQFKTLKELALNKLKWNPHEVNMTIGETEKKRPNGWKVSAQLKISDYFKKAHKFAEYQSKRLISACTKIKEDKMKKKKTH